jgi:hypothetical protein
VIHAGLEPGDPRATVLANEQWDRQSLPSSEAEGSKPGT